MSSSPGSSARSATRAGQESSRVALVLDREHATLEELDAAIKSAPTESARAWPETSGRQNIPASDMPSPAGVGELASAPRWRRRPAGGALAQWCRRARARCRQAGGARSGNRRCAFGSRTRIASILRRGELRRGFTRRSSPRRRRPRRHTLAGIVLGHVGELARVAVLVDRVDGQRAVAEIDLGIVAGRRMRWPGPLPHRYPRRTPRSRGECVC